MTQIVKFRYANGYKTEEKESFGMCWTDVYQQYKTSEIKFSLLKNQSKSNFSML